MGRKRKRTSKKVKVLFLLLLLLFFVLTGLAVRILKMQVEPNLEDVGRLRAKIMVQQIVNKAVNEQLYKSEDMTDLLIRKTDDNGQLEVLQADTQAMNIMMTEISKELQEEFAKREEDFYFVPLGVLMGDKILSQTGPEIKLRIRPVSVSGIDFKTEFESQGINQTKYKVYMDLTSEVRVLAPFVSDTFQISTVVLVAEAIILGNVPGSYVSVPEEDILDVTSE